MFEADIINKLKSFPYLDKNKLEYVLGKNGENLNYWIKKLIAYGTLVPLKKGFYTSSIYLLTLDQQPQEKELYLEYLANMIRYPSYVSLEYALAKYGLIPEGVFTLTSVTTKSTRNYSGKFGTFSYRSISPNLFFGYKQSTFRDKKISIAIPEKALFDFLYLKDFVSEDSLEQELTEGLRLNWRALAPKSTNNLVKLLKMVKSSKMDKVIKVICSQII